MNKDQKITDGMNDRPRNDTIAQTGPGFPDDSSQPVSLEQAEVDRTRAALSENPRQKLKQEVREQTDKPQRGSA